MRFAGPTRREIGVRTAFNLLGPLTNPAGATRAVIGVADASTAARIADVARALGTERTFVVHGAGVDELPLDGTGILHEVTSRGVVIRGVDTRSLGLEAAETSALAGGTAVENAGIIERIFAGEAGPRRDVVLLNAAAAFVVAGRSPDLGDGIRVARETLDAGHPAALVERLRAGRRVAERTSASGTGEGPP